MKLPNEMCIMEFEKLPLEVKRWLIAIVQEFNAACEKHPAWPVDHVHASAIVAEESGELIRAALNYQFEGARFYDMHKEAVQTGAMALRFLLEAGEIEFKDGSTITVEEDE